MNLIKVKNTVIDFDRVVGFESCPYDDFVDIYLCDSGKIFSFDLSVSEFCDLLKFYNIDIKELK